MATVEIDAYSPPCEIVIPKDLPDSDGEPMETIWHRAEIQLLIESVQVHRRGRTNFFVGGNTFVYYNSEQWTTRPAAPEFRGPDFFFVEDVDGTKERKYWLVVDEGGRYPDAIVELLSHSTAQVDRTTKKHIYEKTFKTAEYFLYDPDTKQLEGWRLNGAKYHPIQANDRGLFYSEQLGLWFGLWVGTYMNKTATWLRLFDEHFQLVPLEGELQSRQAEMERRKAEELAHSLTIEQQRVAAQQEEIARLQALLAGKGSPKNGAGQGQ